MASTRGFPNLLSSRHTNKVILFVPGSQGGYMTWGDQFSELWDDHPGWVVLL